MTDIETQSLISIIHQIYSNLCFVLTVFSLHQNIIPPHNDIVAHCFLAFGLKLLRFINK